MLFTDVSPARHWTPQNGRNFILSFIFLATVFWICAGRQSSENQHFVMSQVSLTSCMCQQALRWLWSCEGDPRVGNFQTTAGSYHHHTGVSPSLHERSNHCTEIQYYGLQSFTQSRNVEYNKSKCSFTAVLMFHYWNEKYTWSYYLFYLSILINKQKILKKKKQSVNCFHHFLEF